jgi:ferredoxin
MGNGPITFKAITRIIRFREFVGKLAGLPGLRRVTGWVFGPRYARFSYVPVCENLELPPGTAAPLAVLEHFIEKACHHVILPQCICRDVNRCRDYTHSIGCIFMGEAARDIDPRVGRHVSKDEALAHLRRGFDAGLTPMLGKLKLDAMALGISPVTRMMSICQCCPCCCMFAFGRFAGREARDFFVRFPGVRVEVGGDCDGCGECVVNCLWGQISLRGGRADIGEECKACGRCASLCPRGAVKVIVDDPRFIEQAIDLVSTWTDVS